MYQAIKDQLQLAHLGYLRPKRRGTKASGGVRHGDAQKGIMTDIDVSYMYEM